MKTPVEIKTQIDEVMDEASWAMGGGDAHDLLEALDKTYASLADALTLIQQLETERDAAEEAMFLKPLSWDEAIGDDAFLEIKDDECIDAALNLFACCTCDGSVKDGFVYYETHNTNELKLLEIDYGKTWRCWARRPTDEERAAAVWEVE